MEIVIGVVAVIIFIAIMKNIAMKKRERLLEEQSLMEAKFRTAIKEPLQNMRNSVQSDISDMLKAHEEGLMQGVKKELQKIVPKIKQARET
jgi:hypothetical protein